MACPSLVSFYLLNYSNTGWLQIDIHLLGLLLE